jgi:hypothetical protein
LERYLITIKGKLLHNKRFVILTELLHQRDLSFRKEEGRQAGEGRGGEGRGGRMGRGGWGREGRMGKGGWGGEGRMGRGGEGERYLL